MNDIYQQWHNRLADELALLPDKPEETPASTLHALWHMAAGTQRSARAALLDALPTLDSPALQTLGQLVLRRLGGEPLAHITGRQHFMGLEMLSGREALIPRKETEQLARICIERLQAMPCNRGPVRVIDVCTGSGNLAFAIAHHVAHAQVFGSDISAEAVAFAARNGAHLGLLARVQLFAGDLLAPFEGGELGDSVDLIVCAPPYIHSAKVTQMAAEISRYEPHLAFDGGPFGVSLLLRLIEDAPRLLRSGGTLALEVGLGQGPALVRRLERDDGYAAVDALVDAGGAVRVILASRR